ncbi:MAG: hypothetical protein HC824_01510 [Synechococcales cyanobacterium RM1_1_8]|nr:hypothetical protein [Synechococcales cyanobacterium RM1_1_8]
MPIPERPAPEMPPLSVQDYGAIAALLPLLAPAGALTEADREPLWEPGPNPGYGPQLKLWIQTLHHSGFVFRFDWPQWLPEFQALEAEPGRIDQANWATIRRLMTHYARQESFCPGRWGELIASGMLLRLLQRLAQLGPPGDVGGRAIALKRQPPSAADRPRAGCSWPGSA